MVVIVLKLSTYTNPPFCVPVKHSNQKPGLLVEPIVSDPTPIPHHIGSLDTPILLSTTHTRVRDVLPSPPTVLCVPGSQCAPAYLSTPLNPFKINERSKMPAARSGCSIIPTWFRIPKRRNDTNKYYLWSQLASDSKIREQNNNFCSSKILKFKDSVYM